MTPECSTLIFDLDGTLSDPSVGIIRSFNHALETHGLAGLPDLEIRREIGPPLDDTFLKLAPAIPRADVGKFILTYRERYSDIGYSENTLYSGVAHMLDQLKNAGMRLGVCTSKRSDYAEKILSLFGLIDYFSFVDGGDIGVKKSSQLAHLLAAQAIDDQAIMIGDRAVDVLSAHENTLRAIGVLWGFGGYGELFEVSPLCILDKIEEIPGIVT
jgi:phosphoglycolate phosphatase